NSLPLILLEGAALSAASLFFILSFPNWRRSRTATRRDSLATVQCTLCSRRRLKQSRQPDAHGRQVHQLACVQGLIEKNANREAWRAEKAYDVNRPKIRPPAVIRQMNHVDGVILNSPPWFPAHKMRRVSVKPRAGYHLPEA